MGVYTWAAEENHDISNAQRQLLVQVNFEKPVDETVCLILFCTNETVSIALCDTECKNLKLHKDSLLLTIFLASIEVLVDILALACFF